MAKGKCLTAEQNTEKEPDTAATVTGNNQGNICANIPDNIITQADGNVNVQESYEEFLKNKSFVIESTGIRVETEELNENLFDFQKDIVRWALAKGKAAIFADCGLGKTLMQLEWSEQIRRRTHGKVLIVAPLAVTTQTKEEGRKFGINVNICSSQEDITDTAINITNYEKLDKFVASEFVAVVLDESSILKSYSGKVRNQIISCFNKTPFKLACTATPAPNDYLEPFGGIGSVPYVARKLGRRTVACELKESYYNQMVNNVKNVDSIVEKTVGQQITFDDFDMEGV